MSGGQSAAREADLWERLVNSKWDGAMPILSAEESVAAARRLYRLVMGEAFAGEVRVTSGNRYTWIRSERDAKNPRKWVWVMSVNPDRREPHCRGLRALIHDLSHYCHTRLNGQDSGHSSRQAYLERDMTDYALSRGFHTGALLQKPGPAPKPKPEPVKPDLVAQRHARMVKRRDKYAADIARLTRLHAKAVREVKDYERRHRARLTAAPESGK